MACVYRYENSYSQNLKRLMLFLCCILDKYNVALYQVRTNQCDELYVKPILMSNFKADKE